MGKRTSKTNYDQTKLLSWSSELKSSPKDLEEGENKSKGVGVKPEGLWVRPEGMRLRPKGL